MTRLNLTGQKEQVMTALLTGATQVQAARAAGVAQESVSRWLADRDFVDELEARRGEVWRESLAELRGLLARAVGTLRELLESDDERVRLAAARVVVGAVTPARLEVAGLSKSEVHVAFSWEGDDDDDNVTEAAQ